MDFGNHEKSGGFNNSIKIMKDITVSQLKKKVEAGETVNLVDVREPAEKTEYDLGGILLPLNQILSFQTDTIDHLKNEELICYCRSGKRSLQAALMLETMGFTNVYNLTGGVVAYQEIG